MSNEEKIIELTNRIEVLEKAEAKRIKRKKIRIIFEITKIVIVLGLILAGYIYINNTVIRPYKEKVDLINSKINNVENFVDDKIDNIKDLFKKNN